MGYGIFSELLLHSAFTRLVLGQLKISNHLNFYMFFNYRAFARYSFLFFSRIIGIFEFSSHFSALPQAIWSSKLLYVLQQQGLHKALLFLSSGIIPTFGFGESHTVQTFLYLSTPGPSGTKPALRVVWHLVTLLQAPFFSSPRSKIFYHNIIFQIPTQSSWSLFFPVGHPLNLHSISAVFCLP